MDTEAITRQQTEELREAFAIFDKDGDGSITSEELLTVMSSMRQDATEDEIRDMIQQVDIDGNGTIDFVEFLAMMERSRTKHEKSDDAKRASEEAEMRQAFRVFDLDNNGLIDARELKLTMNNLGEELSDEDVTAMIAAADKNGDGKIDYEEFIKMMYNK